MATKRQNVREPDLCWGWDIHIDGALPPGTTAKDLVLMVIGQMGAQGARGFVVEFCGTAIDELSVEARFTLCSMAVEAGARGALIAPDATAIDYVLASDAGVHFDVEHRFDATQVPPHVTWGTSPDQVLTITGHVPRPQDLPDGPQRRSTNLGCGCSGEHAVWGLQQYGMRAVMDVAFSLAPRHQRMLLERLDVMGLTLTHQAQITAFAVAYWARRPWLQDVARRTVRRPRCSPSIARVANRGT